MISCQQVEPLLWEYYDGECSESNRTAVEGHLTTCHPCQARLDEWVALSQKAFARREQKAPAFLWTRVLAGIEAQEESQALPWWSQWRWMSRVTSVASLAVSLGSFYLFHNDSPSLELFLQGRGPKQQAIQMASTQSASRDQSAVLALEGGE